VTISSFAISGTNASDFAVSNSYFCNTIATFTNCNITVTFNPAAAGVRSATLTITDNATGSPQTVGLSGLGVAVAVTLSAPTALAFPGTVIGTTNQESVLVQNIGTAAANISSITITGTNASDYSIYQSCTTITPASGCNVYVAFTPAGAGVRTASLVITSNAKGSPLTVAMNGIGQAAISTLSLPASIAFPTTTQGTVSTVTFPIYNTGNTTITFSKVAVTGALAADFSVGYWCPTLTPGGECTIYVSFTNVPGGAGLATPNLQFTDNAAGSPQSVLLTGIIQGGNHHRRPLHHRPLVWKSGGRHGQRRTNGLCL
jgi:hypothetical protein